MYSYDQFGVLTFSKRYYIIWLFGRRTRAQFVIGYQPETVHGERQKTGHLMRRQITLRVYILRLVPGTVFAHPANRGRNAKEIIIKFYRRHRSVLWDCLYNNRKI